MPRFEKDLVVVKMQGRPFPSVEEKDSSDWSDWPKLSRVHSILDHTTPARDPSDRCHILATVTKTSPTLPAPQSSGRALLSRWADMWCAKLAPSGRVSELCEVGLPGYWVFCGKFCSANQLLRCGGTCVGLRFSLNFVTAKMLATFVTQDAWFLSAFLSAVGEGKRSVACAVSALKFTAALMGWQEFLCDLDCQVVSAWKQPVGPARACKQAMPLPLFAIAKLERAVRASGSFVKSMDTFLIVCFLVMFWGALRFSDLQRIEVETIELQGVIARGHCWKTKASITGMPWGCLCAGIYGSWAPALAWVCKYMQAHDFMIAGPSGSRASFTYVMAQFRRILVSYGGIPADVVHNYSLHSLKATPLSWALQVEVDHPR